MSASSSATGTTSCGTPFSDLGAAPDLARLAPRRRRAPGESHGLTHRELGLLRLAAAGKTNKVIAAELVLSVTGFVSLAPKYPSARMVLAQRQGPLFDAGIGLHQRAMPALALGLEGHQPPIATDRRVDAADLQESLREIRENVQYRPSPPSGAWRIGSRPPENERTPAQDAGGVRRSCRTARAERTPARGAPRGRADAGWGRPPSARSPRRPPRGCRRDRGSTG
jgi:hypothetical protein